MSDTIRKVDYFSIWVSNTPGQAFKVFSTLVSAGVNLLACSGISRGRRAEIDVVPSDTRKFKRAVKKSGLVFKAEKSGFLIQGEDRSGALAEYLSKLASKGINVKGIDAISAGEGRFGAIIWVDHDDLSHAARLLDTSAK